jgi:integrase/recombinase XerD
MLARVVESYLSVRRACGFELKTQERFLRSFASYSDSKGKHHICSEVAIEWAGLAPSVYQRARRLGHVIRLAMYARVEDQFHELPPAVFGSENRPRPTPYIFSQNNIQRLVQAASELGCRSFRRKTYSTLFALLACTGLRVSEAIRLRFEDITPDGLVVRHTKFRKSRLVPLHKTARDGLESYLTHRCPYAPFDDHIFVSLRRKPLLFADVRTAFRSSINKIGLQCVPGQPRPTPHSLRHTFTVRALETCSYDRDHITEHMLALSTYLGHSKVSATYWYLETTPDLMKSISECLENFVKGGQP